VWYNTTEFAVAWDELLNASAQFENIDTYKHDVVDVTRQALQLLGANLYTTFISAYKNNNVIEFQ
jgi:Alpha-N-acetylglucosaminidase (NAGLU).